MLCKSIAGYLQQRDTCFAYDRFLSFLVLKSVSASLFPRHLATMMVYFSVFKWRNFALTENYVFCEIGKVVSEQSTVNK